MRALRDRVRPVFQRLGWLTTGGLVVLLLGGLGVLVAQQVGIGVFSRIYLGGTGAANPQVRWGSGVPSGATVNGTLYLQTNGTLWQYDSTAVGWQQIANQRLLGVDYYAAAYGALCDGSHDDTVAIQAAINAADATASKAGRVILPAGLCSVSSLVLGAITIPWEPDTSSSLNMNEVGIAVTSGDQTHFAITDGVHTLAAGHVGKTLQFITPLVKSTIGFDGTPFSPTTPTAFEGRWAKYFVAEITGVIDPTHGTMTILGLDTTSGSLRVNQFPDLPHANNCLYPPSGIPGDGCTSSYWCHEHAHLEANCGTAGTSATLDSLVDYSYMTSYQAVNPGLGTVRAYTLPSDTSARFISFKGAGQAKTGLRFLGNTGNPVLAVSKDKYVTLEDFYVYNATSQPSAPSATLAGAGAGNVDNGDHTYKTECVYTNRRSRWSATTSAVTVVDKTTNGKVTVTVPVCGTDGASDTGTDRIVFRTTAGTLGPWYKVAALGDNTTTTYTDNTADASLTLTDRAWQWGNTVGIWYGGLPGTGTQTLVSTTRNVSAGDVNAGFRQGFLIGDNLGGEASELRWERISVSGNDVGWATAAGSFNTLDMWLTDVTGGLNKVAIENADGNVHVANVSFSFNAIDFYSHGFGPFTIENVRTEGPGRVFYGGEPGVVLRNIQLAEPNGARQLTGDVTATPDNTHTETVTLTSTTCPSNICTITFGAGDITGVDPRKIMILPGLGVAGGDLVGTLNSITSTTAGTFQVQSGIPTTAAAVTAVLYDTPTCDLTWPSGQILINDVGAAVRLPEASVTGAWNGGAVRVYITQYLSATTGKGYFYLGNSGRGPVAPAGGTTTNPLLYDHVAVSLQSAYQTTIDNLRGAGRVVVDPDTSGGLVLTNSTILQPTATLLDTWPTPVSLRVPGNRYQIDPYSGTPTSSSSTGILFVGALSSTPPTSRGADFAISTRNVTAQFFAGPEYRLPDGDFRVRAMQLKRLSTETRPLVPSENYYYQNYPFWPVAPQLQFSAVKQLSETEFADGRNLRILCTFGGASDTVVCPFTRSETYTFNSNGTGGTTSDPTTQSYRVLVTSGHFTQADVGKTIAFPDCCGDFALISGGGLTFWGVIRSLFDATHVDMQGALSNTSGFLSGTTTGTATVGQVEPDALWMPALWGCSANETIWISAHDANGVTLKSSNATSTASCLVGVIR